MMKRLQAPGLVVLGALALVVGIAAVARSSSGPPAQAAKSIRLEEATMIIETNATDGDAGLQVFLDGEPWRSMAVSRPGGKRILDVKAKGRLRNFGLTELFSESNEPEFNELPFDRFKRRFPEGQYRFAGRTIEGDRLEGKARLSHDIPSGPQITSPEADSTVARDNAVASWAPVTEPGIDIAGYRAIVEREDPLRVFNADLPAAQTSVTIPPEFLEPGTEFKLEVQAIEANGNQTISEITFRVH